MATLKRPLLPCISKIHYEPKTRKRQRRTVQFNDEVEVYEKSSRRYKSSLHSHDDSSGYTLPTKTSEGVWQHTPSHSCSNADLTSDRGETGNASVLLTKKRKKRRAAVIMDVDKKIATFKRKIPKHEVARLDDGVESALSPFLSSKIDFDHKCILLTRLTEELLEDPQKNVINFRTLLNLIDVVDSKFRNVVVISTGIAFADLLPANRIKPKKGEDESNKTTASKATIERQEYDSSFLKYYKAFVDKLIYGLQAGAYSLVIPIISELLLSSPKYNFNFDILFDEYVKYLWKLKVEVGDNLDRQESSNFVSKYLQTLKTLVKNDMSLDVSLRIVEILTSIVKKHSQKRINSNGNSSTLKRMNSKNSVSVMHSASNDFTDDLGNADVNDSEFNDSILSLPPSETVLDVFIHNLDLERKELEVSMEHGDDSGQKNKIKIDSVTKRQWKSGKVHSTKKKFNQLKSKILQDIICLYLRIVKSPLKFGPILLQSALRGLGQFSRLVNVELHKEIFNEIHQLCKQHSGKFNCCCTLTAIACAINLVRYEEASTLDVDLTWITETLITVTKDMLPYMSNVEDGIDVKHTSKTGGVKAVARNGEGVDPMILVLLRAINSLLTCCPVWDKGAAGSHAIGTMSDLLLLTKNLISTAVHADDRIYALVMKEVQTYLSRFPQLKPIFDVHGAVISSVVDEVSVFWSLELVNAK